MYGVGMRCYMNLYMDNVCWIGCVSIICGMNVVGFILFIEWFLLVIMIKMFGMVFSVNNLVMCLKFVLCCLW